MDKQYPDLYEKLSDEELVIRARMDKKALSELIARNLGTVELLAKKFPSSVAEDLVQEGLMGLLKAVKSYNEDKNARFSTYAGVCIKNKMISSLRKNSVDDSSDFSEDELEGYLGDSGEDIPENIVIEKERMNELYSKISSSLSEQEWQVFQLFLTGMAYNQIALELNVSAKAVDNAMQRVRRKLKSLLR